MIKLPQSRKVQGYNELKTDNFVKNQPSLMSTFDLIYDTGNIKIKLSTY